MRIPVLGVRFDALTLDQAAALAEKLFQTRTGGMIATVNSEILLRCRRDSRLAEAVCRADLVLADGIGVVIASRILGRPLPERVSGADLTPRLLAYLDSLGGSVLLYGGRAGVAGRAAASIRNVYPRLRIVGTMNGYVTDPEKVRRTIRSRRPDLVLVGLGAPRQESFMADSLAGVGSVMIGVGGLLDVIAGDVPRAPENWQRAGMEWLFRLLREPRRMPRAVQLPMVLVLAAAERWKNGTPKGPAG